MKILKIGHMGDAHLTEKKYVDDSKRSLQFIRDEVLSDKEMDALIVPGDVWDGLVKLDKNSPLYFAAEYFKQIADEKPILMIYGNHDKPNSLEIFNIMSENIYVVSKIIELVYIHEKKFYPLSEFKNSGHPKPNAVFYCIPYPEHNKWLDDKTILNGKIEDDELDKKIKEELIKQDQFVKDLGLIDVKKIIVAHGSLEGFIQNEYISKMVADNYHFSIDTFNSINPDYVALGHIHKFQTLMNGKACYPSSIYSVNFGERDKKFFCKITFSKENAVDEFHFEKKEIPTRSREVLSLKWDKNKTDEEFIQLINKTIEDSKSKIDKSTFEIAITAPSRILDNIVYASDYDIKIKTDTIETDPQKITLIEDEEEEDLFTRWYKLKFEVDPKKELLEKHEMILKEMRDEEL